MDGRVAVVTGASDGIGRELAIRLAQAGAELVLPVRDQAKGAAAAAAIRQAVPGARLRLEALDLADLATVAAFTDRLIGEGRPLNLLVNNAGVMLPPARQETADGFELQFGTNAVGHAALTLQLLPLLQAGQARVTAVGPEGDGLVEVIRRAAPDRSYRFIINHGDTDVEVSAAGVELVTGADIASTLRVPAGAVRVIREDPAS